MRNKKYEPNKKYKYINLYVFSYTILWFYKYNKSIYYNIIILFSITNIKSLHTGASKTHFSLYYLLLWADWNQTTIDYLLYYYLKPLHEFSFGSLSVIREISNSLSYPLRHPPFPYKRRLFSSGTFLEHLHESDNIL